MKWSYGLAGLLALGAAGLHAFMGGIGVVKPLMAANMDLNAKLVMLAVWHAITVLFILSAVAFFAALKISRERMRPLGIFLGLFYLLFAGIFAALSYFWFGDVIALPQWTLLAPLGIFALVGAS